MNNLSAQPKVNSEVKAFLHTILAKVLSPEKYAELNSMLDNLLSQPKTGAFYMSFSRAVRMFGKDKLNYNANELKNADELHKNWTPPSSVDKAVRLLILLQISDENEPEYLTMIENLFASGNVGEMVALYSALPLMSYPEKLIIRCMEGVRTNMGEVFEAVANHNPFPAEYLSEDAFNQMVLKCLFVGKPLYKVVNLQFRLNKNLARMANDYAHERWSAERKVNPELWQLVAPYLEVKNMKDIQRLALSEDELERKAAALVCSISPLTELKEINYPLPVESVQLNWKGLGTEVWNNG